LNSAWLIYDDQDPEEADTFPESCTDARTLLSILVGRRLPFLWRDQFLEGGQLRRTYRGGPKLAVEIAGHEQPVPLGSCISAFKHGKEVSDRIPRLYARLKEIRDRYNIDFILSPLWSGFDEFVDDQLGLACVTLERLATANDDAKRKSGKELVKKEFLTPDQANRLSAVLKPAVQAVAGELGLSGETIRILDRRIDNLHQAPNADKLEQVFTDVGICLTETERKALGNRNRCLHGVPTLKGRNFTHIEEEVLRIDTLRTVINKGILGLLRYDGPYIDYGARPPEGEFPIGRLADDRTPGEAAT